MIRKLLSSLRDRLRSAGPPSQVRGRLLRASSWDEYMITDGRRVPDVVRRQLLELEPLSCLVYIGESKWQLGLLNANSKQKRAAQDAYAAELAMENSQQRQVELELHRLRIRGFMPVWMYEQAEADSRIVDHLRAMLWVEQNAVKTTMRKALDASDWYHEGLPRRQEQMLDAVTGLGHDALRYRVRRDGTKQRVNILMS